MTDKARSWKVTSPDFPRVNLRLHVQRIDGMAPLDALKCSLQVVEAGKPLASHPVDVTWRTEAELQTWIEECQGEGWVFESLIRFTRADAYMAQKSKRAELSADGKCPRCGGPNPKRAWCCRACRDVENMKRKDRRAKDRAEREAGLHPNT